MRDHQIREALLDLLALIHGTSNYPVQHGMVKAIHDARAVVYKLHALEREANSYVPPKSEVRPPDEA